MEKELQPIQVSIDPNIYGVSNINMVFNEEDFHFMIMSGNQGRQFVATPKHAKRIYLLLKQQIENYEKQFGEIKTQLPESRKNTQEENNKTFF